MEETMGFENSTLKTKKKTTKILISVSAVFIGVILISSVLLLMVKYDRLKRDLKYLSSRNTLNPTTSYSANTSNVTSSIQPIVTISARERAQEVLYGTNYYAFGHSFGLIQNPVNTVATYPTRIIKTLLTATTSDNLCANGQLSQIAAVRLLGTAQGYWPPGNFGFATLMTNQNDVGTYHGVPEGELSFKNAIRTFINVMESRAKMIATSTTDATLTGTWTTVTTASNASSGGYKSTSELNAKLTFVTTVKSSKLCVILFGLNTNTGSDFSITVDGTLVASGNTSRSSLPISTLAPFPVNLYNLSNDFHTVVITKLGSTGTLNVDSMLVLGQPNPLIIIKDTYCTNVGYNRYNPPPVDADVDLYNKYIDDVVGEYGDRLNSSLYVVDLNNNGWNRNTMICPDGQHPNDVGQSFIAKQIFKLLADWTFKKQVNVGLV